MSTGRAMLTSDPYDEGSAGSDSEVSELREQARRLKHLANHDPLTQLPNRLLLSERLKQLLVSTRHSGRFLAVCYLDLDGFKAVNDQLGHDAGDELLVAVAHRLKGGLRAGDHVARLGGDEFVVLLTGLKDKHEYRLVLNRLLSIVATPYRVAGVGQSGISASIGVTLFPIDDSDPATLLRHADQAMYEAKRCGKNCHCLYSLELAERVLTRAETRIQLDTAMRAGQLRLSYRPVIDFGRGRVIGTESVIQWEHPTAGLISSNRLLPFIEHSDATSAVVDWAIRGALEQTLAWREQGLDIPVSVDLFSQQLRDLDFADKLAGILSEHGRGGDRGLELQIAEIAALEYIDRTESLIDACAELGVRVTLGDYGSGYASPVHLRQLAVQRVKIDQSCIQGMLSDHSDHSDRSDRSDRSDHILVQGIVALARIFGVDVVAAGVHDSALIPRLLDLGCNLLQGDALVRPMSGDNFIDWYRNYRPKVPTRGA